MTKILADILWLAGVIIFFSLAWSGLFIMFSMTYSPEWRVFPETIGITFCSMILFIPSTESGLSVFLSISRFMRSLFGSDIKRRGWLEIFLSDGKNIAHISHYCVIIITLLVLVYIFTAERGKRLTALTFLPLIVLIEGLVMTTFIESTFSFSVFVLILIFGFLSKFPGNITASHTENASQYDMPVSKTETFAERYHNGEIGHDRKYYYLISNTKRHGVIRDEKGNDISVFVAYDDGTLSDDKGRLYYPDEM